MEISNEATDPLTTVPEEIQQSDRESPSISNDNNNNPEKKLQNGTHVYPGNHEIPAQTETRQTPSSITSGGESSLLLSRSERELGDFPTLSNGLSRDFDEVSAISDVTDDEQSPNSRRLMLMIFVSLHFTYGCYYAMLGPFLPALADDRNLSSTMTGILMGVFEWIVIISAVFYGKYISNIGAKFMYLTGAMAFGYTVVLMGFLEYCPPDMTFVLTTIAIRIFENLAVSALLTASFAIIARAYPDSIASMFGVLELANGVGMMLGPVLGGSLYGVGGFKLPFIVLGSIIMLLALAGVFLIPHVEGVISTSNNSMFVLLRIPSIVMMSLIVFISSMVMSYYDVALSVFLEDKFDLSAIMMGVVFMTGAGLYAATAPLWGRIADRQPKYCNLYIVFGFLVAGISQQFLGPAPFLPIRTDLLWLVFVSQCFIGIGVGTLIVTFEVITTAASEAGHPDDLATYGLISSLWNSCFSLGAFGGSVGGGLLNDYVGFEWSSSITGFCLIFSALLLLGFNILQGCVKKDDDTISEETAAILDTGRSNGYGTINGVKTNSLRYLQNSDMDSEVED